MNRALLRNPVALGLLLLAAVILFAGTFRIIDESHQAVVLRFEQPIRTINGYQPGEQFGRTGAGIILRVPFIDRVVMVDKRVLDVDLENQPVLSTDQRRLEVDAFARFRIVDPLRMVVTAGSEQRVADQLRPLFSSALRNELGRRQFSELLSPERTQLMDNIQAGLQRRAGQYGVEIVDVRIKHADLPDGSPLESALAQMRSARQQEAATIRAQGQKQAQIIQATAEAQAAQVYAQSFTKDADFYDFYRAMQSYRHTFGTDGDGSQRGSTALVLSPNNAYLRQFQGAR